MILDYNRGLNDLIVFAVGYNKGARDVWPSLSLELVEACKGYLF